MKTVAIYCPGYPERSGGVTDHTRRLVSSWTTAERNVHVLGSEPRDLASLAADLEACGAHALLAQYVPFLFGRWGVSGVPVTIARRARQLGMRTVLFVHEPWVPPTRIPWLALSPLQRRQTRQLARACDIAVTAVPAWRDRLRTDAALLYVGSTLPAYDADSPGEPLDSPVVFSPFAAGLRWDWIRAAVDSIGRGLTVVGCTEDEAARHPATRRYVDRAWEYLGRLPAPDAIRAIGRAPLVLAPFVDGITGRRTSVLAALSTGVPVISSGGHLLDPVFRDGPVALATSAPQFTATARRVWHDGPAWPDRSERMTWYRKYFDPRVLDARLLDLLEGRG